MADDEEPLNRSDPTAVLAAYDKIVAKNKSLLAEVEEGEKALGRQLKDISKLQSDATLQKQLYDTAIQERIKLQEDNQKLQTANEQLRETIRTLETRLSDAEAKAKSAPPQAKSDDPTTLKLVESNKELTKQLDDAVVEKQTFQTTIEKLNEKVARYSQTSTKLSKDVEEWKSKHHDLEGKVEGLEEQNRLIA